MALQLKETTFVAPGGVTLRFDPKTGAITVADPGPTNAPIGSHVAPRHWAKAFELATGGGKYVKQGDWNYILMPDGTPYTFRANEPFSMAREAGRKVVQGKMSPRDAIIKRVFGGQIPESKEIPTKAATTAAAPKEAGEVAEEAVEERPTTRISDDTRTTAQELDRVQALGRSRRTALLRGLGALVSGQSLGQAIEPRQLESQAERDNRRRLLDNLTKLEQAQRKVQEATIETKSKANLELMKAAFGIVETKITSGSGVEREKVQGEMDLAKEAMKRANEVFKLETPEEMMSDRVRGKYANVRNQLSGLTSIPDAGSTTLIGMMDLIQEADAAAVPAIKRKFEALIRDNEQLQDAGITDLNTYLRQVADENLTKRFEIRLGEGERARGQIISDADTAKQDSVNMIVAARQKYGPSIGRTMDDVLKAMENIYASDDPAETLNTSGQSFAPSAAFKAIESELEAPTTALLTPSRAKKEIQQSQEYQDYEARRMEGGEVNRKKIFREYARDVRQRGRQKQQAAEEMGGRETKKAQEGLEQAAEREEEDIIQPIASPEETPETSEASKDQVGWARRKGQALQSIFKNVFEGQEEKPGPQVINQKYREGSPLEPGRWEDPEEGIPLSQQQLRGIPQVRREMKYGGTRK